MRQELGCFAADPKLKNYWYHITQFCIVVRMAVLKLRSLTTRLE
jgi:hypothetical protein